jgi:hypothetical protein
MNERIKELYTEATAWALHNYPPPVNTFEWEDLRNNKFAELIVRECAKIANRQFEAATGLDDRDSLTAAEMKKHFGVEL